MASEFEAFEGYNILMIIFGGTLDPVMSSDVVPDCQEKV
jgi:hypothetical protein